MPREQTRWLSGEERRLWLGLSRIMSKLPSVLDDQLERDADLNYFEYIVLAMLSEQADGTLRMSVLAATTNAALPRLSNVVKRLEARKLLRRKADPDDGRFTQAVLTKAGRALVVQTAPGHVETVRELVIDAITATQLRQLQPAFDRIIARLDPDGAPLSAPQADR